MRTSTVSSADGTRPTRVIIIDNHEISRAACKALLRAEGIDVTADLRASDQALTAARTLRPDVAIIDVTPAAEAGFGIADGLRALPAPPTVILTSSTERTQFGARLNGLWFVVPDGHGSSDAPILHDRLAEPCLRDDREPDSVRGDRQRLKLDTYISHRHGELERRQRGGFFQPDQLHSFVRELEHWLVPDHLYRAGDRHKRDYLCLLFGGFHSHVELWVGLPDRPESSSASNVSEALKLEPKDTAAQGMRQALQARGQNLP